MKRLAFILCFVLAIADSAFAALSAATIWEARSATGADPNGGGFVAGSGGTDYSQQDAPQLTVADGVTVGSTTVTSVTGGFTAAMVGSIMNIVSDGRYQITARASTNSITVDRATGTATGLTLNVGGALGPLAITTLSTTMVASNKAYLKGATFTSTSTSTFAQAVGPTGNTAATRLIGYTTTRGDNGQFLLTLQTNTGLIGLSATGTGFYFENCAVDCASLGTSIGIQQTNTWGRVVKCKVSNFTTKGIRYASSSSGFGGIWENEVTAGTSAATCAIESTGAASVIGNFVHDNACTGIINSYVGTSITSFNLVTNNTGATSDGIQVSYSGIVTFNTCHANGRDGIRNTTIYPIGVKWLNNILTSNVGAGITGSSATAQVADANYDGNAYWNNGSPRALMDNVTGIFAVNPYTNTRDKTLTGDPYTNAAGNDFSLNNTASAGALCRGTAVPGLFVGSSSTSVGDMGAVQAAAAAASGTSHTFLQ